MKKKRLEDPTYAETKQLDIGAFRGPQFTGQRIVSLAEIVAALTGGGLWRPGGEGPETGRDLRSPEGGA